MKKLILVLACCFFFCEAFSQALIATSLNPDATANHNQRKIVRDIDDNIFVVFTDLSVQESIIKGVKFNVTSQSWGEPSFITEGNNPTIAISLDGKLHLVYVSNDELSRIKYISSNDFINWSEPLLISDPQMQTRLPVADVDGSNRLNILWIQEYEDIDSLFYAGKLNEDVIKKSVFGRENIIDVSIANHLNYENNVLHFGLRFDADSVLFFYTYTNMAEIHLYHEVTGSSPSITYNTAFEEWDDFHSARVLYICNSSNIREAQMDDYWEIYLDNQLQEGPVDFLSVDNLAYPIGYSYLFMKNGILYHGFSYGPELSYSTIRDTISSNPLNPSIAYKTFRFEYVDFIWMEDAAGHFNIFHMRSAKYDGVRINDPEKDKGFLFTAYPNPFTDQLTLNVTVEEGGKAPGVKIYNVSTQLVNELQPTMISGMEYEFRWKADNFNGKKIKPGLYIIHCSAGGKAVARKVMYIPR
jgi:hypothetical protein